MFYYTTMLPNKNNDDNNKFGISKIIGLWNANLFDFFFFKKNSLNKIFLVIFLKLCIGYWYGFLCSIMLFNLTKFFWYCSESYCSWFQHSKPIKDIEIYLWRNTSMLYASYHEIIPVVKLDIVVTLSKFLQLKILFTLVLDFYCKVLKN